MKTTQDKQKGFTTLAISLILLVVLTMMTLYSAQVGVLKQRIAANEVRERESRINADTLIERGLQFVFANRRHLRSTAAGGGWLEAGNARWATCADAALPCGDGTNVLYGGDFVYYSFTDRDITEVSDPLDADDLDIERQLHLVAEADGAGPAEDAVYTLIAVSPASDDTGESIVQQAFWLTPLLSDPPDAPLIVAGGITLSGNFNVATNPNGGGPGVPLSVWTDQNANITGSGNSCQIEEYDDNGGCGGETGQLSNSGHEGLDILDEDGDSGVNPDSTYFPDDMFEYVFGVAAADWQEFKTNNVPADHVLDDGCGDLDETSAGLYWVTGDCILSNNATVGSPDAPVILVVQEGEFRMNGTSTLFGLVFSFDAPGNGVAAGSITINGTATVSGSMMANHTVDISSGTFNARYDADVLQRLSEADENKGVGKIPGSWADYL
jgi:hypothetical protein